MSDTTIAEMLLGLINGKTGPFVCAAPYELRDIRSGEYVGIKLSSRAQSVRCSFCRKTLASWPARTKRRSSGSMPDALQKIYSDHLPKCSHDWARSVVIRWALGTASNEEHNAVVELRKRYHVTQVLADMGWRDQRDSEIARRLFDNLPQRVDSEFVHYLEITLHEIHREVRSWPANREP